MAELFGLDARDGSPSRTAAATPTVTLVSASPTVKAPRNVKQLARTLVTFDVLEENASALADAGVAFVHAAVQSVDTETRMVVTVDGRRIPYDRLCICSGAAPRLVVDHPSVLGIRDTDSVQVRQRPLRRCIRPIAAHPVAS